eukprot:RCo014642
MTSTVLVCFPPEASAASPLRSVAFQHPKAMKNLFSALGTADTMRADSSSPSVAAFRIPTDMPRVTPSPSGIAPRLDAALRRAHAKTPLWPTRRWRRTMLTSLAVDLSTQEASPRDRPRPLQLKPLQATPSGYGEDVSENEDQQFGLSSTAGSSHRSRGISRGSTSWEAAGWTEDEALDFGSKLCFPRRASLPPLRRSPRGFPALSSDTRKAE